MRGLSAPVRGVLLVPLANLCVTAMTCTIRLAAVETAAPPARSGL